MGLSRPALTQPTSQVIGMKLEKTIVDLGAGREGHYMFNSASKRQRFYAQFVKNQAI